MTTATTLQVDHHVPEQMHIPGLYSRLPDDDILLWPIYQKHLKAMAEEYVELARQRGGQIQSISWVQLGMLADSAIREAAVNEATSAEDVILPKRGWLLKLLLSYVGPYRVSFNFFEMLLLRHSRIYRHIRGRTPQSRLKQYEQSYKSSKNYYLYFLARYFSKPDPFGGGA